MNPSYFDVNRSRPSFWANQVQHIPIRLWYTFRCNKKVILGNFNIIISSLYDIHDITRIYGIYIYIHMDLWDHIYIWIYMGFIYIYIHDGILHGYYMLIFRNNCYSRISIMPKFGQLDNFTEAAVAARVERLASDLQRQDRQENVGFPTGPKDVSENGVCIPRIIWYDMIWHYMTWYDMIWYIVI